jgi:hypothetical protein
MVSWGFAWERWMGGACLVAGLHVQRAVASKAS